jgi:ATP-dependent DNA helicase RecG
MKIAKGPDEFLRPTNAGLLLFNEHPEQFFAGAKIELVIHKGNVGKNYIEKIFTGSLVNQVRDVLNFFKTNIIQEQVSKAPNQAEAVRFFNYPYQAIEEAVVNAVYHKSYERENPVEIQIHPDKIEILSFPGPMPPIDNKMLKKERVVAREYRNRKLGGFLKELKLTEGRGTGLPIIYSRLDKNGSPPPIFETDDDRSYFLSIIKIHPLTQKESAEDKDVETIENVSQFNSLKDAIFYLRSSGNQNVTKDNIQIISILIDIAKHLRSANDQRLTQEEKQYRNKGDLIFVKTLMYCNTPKTREEIFKHIEIYNNSRNFREYIQPVIELNWLQYTIPGKPTSKNQKYITAPYVIKWIEEDKINIKRTPVASSNIASVGYDAENQILEIEFHHGAIYQYFDVPKEVYDELMRAGAIGSYYMNEIKEKFKNQKK